MKGINGRYTNLNRLEATEAEKLPKPQRAFFSGKHIKLREYVAPR